MERIKIKCKTCGRSCLETHIKKHIKNMHKINFNEYVKENIEDFKHWKKCPACSIPTIQKTTCSRKCEGEHKRIIMTGRKGHKFTEAEKKKIGKSQKKRFSKSGSKDYLIGENNSSCKPEVRKKIAKTRLERGCGVGEKNSMFGKTHTPEAIKKIFSHRKINKTEKIVADLLDKHNIEYDFQFFINRDGVCKSYDFKIKGKSILIEVDGDFWHGGPGSKTYWKDVDKVQENDILKEEIAKQNGYKLFRFWESELKKDANVVLQYLY